MIRDYSTIPPIRTPLIDPSGDGSLTQKEWYQFWNQLQDSVNALGNAIQFGGIGEFPDPFSVPTGSLYMVSDPGWAIYQNLDDGWHYVAGVMWGTMSPDQRPTGLGPNDSGLQFRSTDLPSRYFIWSGSVWVDAAPTRYGTHAARLALVIANTADAMMFAETDRSEVIYQLQNGAWHYLAGTMWSTFSPDTRPTDLGANDAGFQWRSTDLPARFFIWSGSAWVDAAPPVLNNGQIAAASAQITLTTSMQAIPGTTITLPVAGKYIVHGTFYFIVQNGDGGNFILGGIPTGGADALLVIAPAMLIAGQTVQSTVSQQWLITASAGMTVNLQAQKTGGTGTTAVGAVHTTISAWWVGP